MSGMTVRGMVVGRVAGILTPGVAPTFSGRGVASVVQNAAGDYTFTFATECQLEPTTTLMQRAPRIASRALEPTIASFTDTAIRIQTYDNAGALQDQALELMSFELPPTAE